MAKNTHPDFSFESRKMRGYQKEKPPPGFNRFWSPIICGVANPDGSECLEKTPGGLSRCDRHQAEFQEAQNLRIRAQRRKEVSE
jgi:hypothetical protein